jgi:putative aldouronate transport system substrate-binding protein
MGKSKIILSLALAAVVAIPGTLSGCSAKNTSSTTTSSNAVKPTVTLQLFTGDKNIPGLARVTTAVNAYLKSQNTGLAISWTTMDWGTLGTKLNTMLETGQNADIINTSSWIGNGYVQWASDGYLTDLSKYVNDPANSDLVNIITKSFLGGTEVGGKYYGLPTNKEKAHDFGFLLQTAEVKKLGIDTSKIKKLADLEQYFPQVVKDGYIPLVSASMDNPFKELDWDPVIDDNTPGALDPSTDESTIVDQFTAPSSVAYYNTMKTFYNNGWISKDASTDTSEETDMATGKYFMGSWSLMPGKAITEAASLKLGLTQIDITPVEETNRETLGALLAIPKASQHPDQAFQFMKLLYTDKTLINLMTFGVSGTDYTTNANGSITQTSTSDFNSAGGWIMGNEFNNKLMASQSQTLWTDIASYNASAKPLKSLGFVFDTTNVKNQLAACDATITKEYPALFTGSTPNVATAVATLTKDLNTDGVSTVISTMQTQYDAYQKTKS